MTATLSQRRQARRDELVDAALRSIRELGPDVSMEQIAAEAGVTKPILYRHFGDKDGLCEAVAQKVLGEMMADMARTLDMTQPAGPQVISRTMDLYFRWAENDTNVYLFLKQKRFESPEAQQS